MKILSIGKIKFNITLDICYIEEANLSKEIINTYDYIIINGGDGAIRRILKAFYAENNYPKIIINPIGSFNVVAKLHRVKKVEETLTKILNQEALESKSQNLYLLNEELFLFSAGNMGDLQHIFLSETLRFGLLKKGMLKYIISFILLLPTHILFSPFMLLSKRKFFIFTPLSLVKKFGSFYGKIEQEIKIDLKNSYNFVQLDGDVVLIKERFLEIKKVGEVEIIKG